MKLKRRTPEEGERQKLTELIRYALDVHPFKHSLFEVRAGEDDAEVLVIDGRARYHSGQLRPLEERTLTLTATEGRDPQGRQWTLWYSYWQTTRQAPGHEPVDEVYAVEDYAGQVAKAAALWPEALHIEDALDVRLQDDFERALHAGREGRQK